MNLVLYPAKGLSYELQFSIFIYLAFFFKVMGQLPITTKNLEKIKLILHHTLTYNTDT